MKAKYSHLKERAKKDGDRSSVSLYLDRDIFDAFKKDCENEGLKASRLLEEFMKEYSAPQSEDSKAMEIILEAARSNPYEMLQIAKRLQKSPAKKKSAAS